MVMEREKVRVKMREKERVRGFHTRIRPYG
jgi:hypothetical protein